MTDITTEASLKQLLSEKNVAGYREVVRGIRANRIRCVAVAENADKHMKRELATMCKQNGINVVFRYSKEELGSALGLDVACATVGFLKEGQ